MINSIPEKQIPNSDFVNLLRNELCQGSISQVGEILYYRSNLLDFSNDEIVLKIVPENNKIIVSDNNRVILNLLSSGFDPYSTKKREFIIDKIAGSCDVNIDKYGEVYSVVNNFDEVGEAVFWMVHAIQRLTSMVIESKTYRPQMFKKEIVEFLTENKVKYNENPIYHIGKKHKAKIDFESISTSDKKIFRAMSYSDSSSAMTYSEKFIFETDIIKKNMDKKIFPVAIIDDISKTEGQEPVFNEDVLQVLEKVKVIPWSQKEKLIEDFIS